MIKKYIGGRSCALLGLGVSHLPLARLLCENGISLTVYDKASPRELGEDALALSERGVRFVRSDKEFCGISEQLVFRSPGIRPDRAGLVAAEHGGAEITSETELFLRLTGATTIGITGSDGKTTTTTLTGKFLQAASKKTYVGGNIGTPLLTLAPEMREGDCAVLELSSFQLMSMTGGVMYAAITNISQNHLDWHTDMSEYICAKKNIIGKNTRRLVTNAECSETLEIARQAAKEYGTDIFLFSSKKASYGDFCGLLGDNIPFTAIYVREGDIAVDNGSRAVSALSVSDINVPGTHNIENFMTAIGITYGLVPCESYTSAAKDFFGVEHRLELVRVADGVSYCNSSIDSSPARTAAALSAMKGKSLVLICGGYDKNLDYAPLAKAIFEHGGVHSLVLTGATGKRIENEIALYSQAHPSASPVSMCYISDFTEAVHTASRLARKGDCVLLSPASASFDAFKNFMERGKTFKNLVNEL